MLRSMSILRFKVASCPLKCFYSTSSFLYCNRLFSFSLTLCLSATSSLSFSCFNSICKIICYVASSLCFSAMDILYTIASAFFLWSRASSFR